MPFERSEFEGLSEVIGTIQAQFSGSPPDVAVLQDQVEKLEETQRTLGEWLAPRFELSADEFAKEFGKRGAQVAAASIGVGTMWLLGLFQFLGSALADLWKYIGILLG